MSRQRRGLIIAAIASLIGSIIFFLPLVGALQPTSSGWPGFMMSGDIQKFYFPSFVEGYRRFWNGGLLGIDFLTAGGASVFAFRANLMPFYPPYLASYLLFDVSNLSTAAVVYCAIHVLHMWAAIYTSMRLGRRFLGFGLAGSFLFAFLFALSSQAASYIALATFYFQMMLVPVVAYTLCRLMLTRSPLQIVLSSMVFVTLFLSSYGPTMACAFAAAVILSGYVYAVRIRPRFRAHPLWRLLAPFVSLAIAGAVALPYYLAQWKYASEVAPSFKTLQATAFDLAFSGLDLVNGLSQSMRMGTAVVEGRLNWNLIPALLIILGMVAIALRSATLSNRQTQMFGFAAAIYVGFLSITLGTSLPTADMFYYGVPILGSMHIFQRYLAFGQIFFALAASGGIVLFTRSATPAWRGILLGTGLVGWFTISLWMAANRDSIAQVEPGRLLSEMFVCLVAICLLSIAKARNAIIGIALLSAVVSVQQMYSMQYGLGRPTIWATELDPVSEDQDKLLAFLERTNAKALSKMVYLTPGPGTYLYRNYPWLVGSDVKVMSFQGYETHLSIVRGYWALMGGAYGEHDRDWVLRTGFDYIVWDDATADRANGIPASMDNRVRLGESLRLGPSLSITKIEFDAPVTFGMGSPSLELPSANSAAWPPVTISDGWAIEAGKLVRTSVGALNNFHVATNASGNATYELSFSVEGTGGLLTSALGGFGADPLPITGPGRYSIILKPIARGDLWIGATNDFTGTISDVVLQELTTSSTSIMPSAFDNGILRVEGKPGTVSVGNFATNYASQISLDLAVTEPARLVYLLWPIDYMVPYLDGQRVQWTREANWPSYIDLQPGEHNFELRFESTPGTIFVWSASIYAGIMVLLTLFWLSLLAVPAGRRAAMRDRRGMVWLIP